MLSGFTAGLLLITCAELGDKTFFISLCLAMRFPRRWVFLGAIAALALMTLLSVVMGQMLTLLPKDIVHYSLILLFVLFGLKLLYDASQMQDGSLAEVEQEACASIDEQQLKNTGWWATGWAGGWSTGWATVSKSFVMTFLAEWGDRTQFATASLAADYDPIGVILGGILGHTICAAIAVYAGKAIASRLSEKVITAIGGALFLVFAGVSAFQGVG
jgi:Ca2+/H+ antiporter, TMEM165/GDT1 family